MVLVKVSVAPCHSFFMFGSLSSRVVDPCHFSFRYGFGCGSRSSDPYLSLTDSVVDPGDAKTYGCGSGTLIKSRKEVRKE